MRTGLSETQGAALLEAGKICRAVGFNKIIFCILNKHLGRIGIFWHGFRRFLKIS